MARKRTPPSITTADTGHSEDTDDREKRYMITMAIRMVCLGLMIFVQPFGWHTLAFFLGAAFLPYIAVINANNGRKRNASAAKATDVALQEAPTTKQPEPAHDGPLVIRLEPKNEDDA